MSSEDLIDTLVRDVVEVIASLDPSTCNNDPTTIIQDKLEDLLVKLQNQVKASSTSTTTIATFDRSSNGGGVTPLLVACDKGNVLCLEYLQKYYNVAGIGSPLQPSSREQGGNTPVHHAAMAGCDSAWKILCALLILSQHGTTITAKLNNRHESLGDDSNNNIIQKPNDSKEADWSSPYLTLGSLINAHGDTPLQMAILAGHLSFVQTWYNLCCCSDKNDYPSAPTKATTSRRKEEIQKVLQMSNHAGDTCASLACCHGFVDSIGYLLETCQISVSHDEVKTCQVSVDRMDKAIQQVQDPTALKQYQERQSRVHECLAKLQAVLKRQVEMATNELLLADSDLVTINNGSRQKPSKKNRKKRKEIKTTAKDQTEPLVLGSNNNDDDKPTTKSEEKEESIMVKRLEDGRVAVAVTGEDFAQSIQANTGKLLPPMPPQPSVQTMFRERFRGQHQTTTNTTPTTTPTSTNTTSTTPDSSIDAVMDALCLDVSMLLYTPHSMALNLSPSQLEAIEQILKKQIVSLQEARRLQHKRHQTNNNNNSDDKDDKNERDSTIDNT